MKYFIRTMTWIFFFTALLFPFGVAAADNTSTSAPAVIFEDGTEFPADLIDKDREEGKIAVYTINYGEFTKPFTTNTHEFVIVNNIVVNKSTNGLNGTYIPPNGCVLSYTGNDEAFVDNLDIGSNLTLVNIDIPVLPDMYFIIGDILVPIDNINTVRDANQVILYNPSFGESTKTNVWGMELTVVDNTITQIADLSNNKEIPSGSNSMIPEKGLVLSIHVGSPYYKQLHEKAKPGDTIKVSADAKLYNASKIKYAAYNPRTIEDNPEAWDKYEGKPYDGFRGPNQLIIYDSSYGDSTGTNPYGYEVTLSDDGIITGSGGNDLTIPEGGYILSGHGDSLKWLEKYALLGATVTLNSEKKEVTIILSPESYLNRADYSIRTAKNSLELARQQYLDIQYDKVSETIGIAEEMQKKLEEQVNQSQYEGLTKAAEEIQEIADNAYYMTFESIRIENRAVWLRPRDTGIEQIKKRLDMLKELNINILYLETYWNGYAIYPTGNAILQQNPIFNGLDILEVYLKEAHARGIEVHAWVENFLTDLPVAAKKPEWMSVSRKGDTYYLENGTTKYHFLNPALPEVRNFLSDLYKNLVRKYNLDGIQFDYMRYSHSGNYTNDFGYDSYTRQLFNSYTGTDPIDLKPDDKLWEKWCSFRTQLISTYAYRVISEVKSLKPGIRVSADVWPEYDKTLSDIFQDPKSWVRNDYINSLIPMSYYLYEGPVADDIMNSLEFSRGYSQITSGIASFNKVDTKVFLKQIAAIRKTNTNGIAIFEFETLFNRNYSSVLKPGAFSTSAAVTNKSPVKSVSLLLDDIIRKIDDIYVTNDGMTDVQSKIYKKLIREINTVIPDDTPDSKAAYSVKNSIEEVILTLSKDESLNKEIKNRIVYDLKNAVNIVEGYISSNRFITDHEVRRFQIELPFKTAASVTNIPFKVKAVFDDGSSMYLDKTQYKIYSGKEAAADIVEDRLLIKDEKIMSLITIDILDSFSFNTAKGVPRKAEFVINRNGSAVWDPEYGVLKAHDVSFTTVKLDWGSTVIDSDIIGYIVYCNGKEIARTPEYYFDDRNLQPGGTYTYFIKGFDSTGNIIYESSEITAETKALPLLASE